MSNGMYLVARRTEDSERQGNRTKRKRSVVNKGLCHLVNIQRIKGGGGDLMYETLMSERRTEPETN